MYPKILTVGLAAVLGLMGAAQAQTGFEWKQIVNVPKGANVPSGISAEILGIEVGMAFDDAQKRLKQLAEEFAAPKVKQPETADEVRRRIMSGMLSQMTGADEQIPYEEITNRLRLPVSPPVEVSYVAKIEVDRTLPANGKDKTKEKIRVFFSSPSSGHQVVAVERYIRYPSIDDQPRISEVLAALKAKFGAEPKKSSNANHYSIVFVKGNVSNQAVPYTTACNNIFQYERRTEDGVAAINATRECDVFLGIEMTPGLSPAHAGSIEFKLVDGQRMRENFRADFAYLREYMLKLQQGKGAAPPKL